MRLLLLLLLFKLTSLTAKPSAPTPLQADDTAKINQWTREDFIKEFGANDSARALIRLFFKKKQMALPQSIIGSLLIGGTAVAVVNQESGDDTKGAEIILIPVAAATGLVVTTVGAIKLGKFTKQKLYSILHNYKNGIALPKKYRKKLKPKYFS